MIQITCGTSSTQAITWFYTMLPTRDPRDGDGLAGVREPRRPLGDGPLDSACELVGAG